MPVVSNRKANICEDQQIMSTDASTDTPQYRTYTDKFLNKRGKKIYCYYWEPKAQPKALLYICHGFTDHTMLYASLAEEMVKKGFFVFGHDHVGHGRSEGRRAHMQSINHIVEDAVHHVDNIRLKLPDLPLFLFGHSLGGAVSILTSLQRMNDIQGMVLLAPAISSCNETAPPVKIFLAKVCGVLIPSLPVAFADVTLSCRDLEQIEKLNNDPLRHHGYFKAKPTACLLKGGEIILKNKESVSVPYLLLHGDCDKVCDIKGSEMLHAGSCSKDKSFIVYSGAYHSLFQEPTEVSSDVFNRTVQWLTERV